MSDDRVIAFASVRSDEPPPVIWTAVAFRRLGVLVARIPNSNPWEGESTIGSRTAPAEWVPFSGEGGLIHTRMTEQARERLEMGVGDVQELFMLLVKDLKARR